MGILRVMWVGLVAASAAWAGTERDKLVALRAQLAAKSLLGRTSGWRREIQFAAQVKDPAFAAEVVYDVARSQLRQDSRLAVTTLETLLKRHAKTQPWAALATYELATIHAGRDSTRREAIALFEKFLAMEGLDPVRTAKATAALAGLHYNAGNRSEALALSRALVGKFPGYDGLCAEALGRIGRIAVDLKQLAQAEEASKKLSAQYPFETAQRSSLLAAMIQAYRAAENHPAAIAASEKYLAELNTGSSARHQIYVGLATLHAQQHNDEAAAAVYLLMAADPVLSLSERSRAHRYLLSHYRRVGNHAAVVRHAYELIAAQPAAVTGSDGFLASFADALIETGRTDEALAMAKAYFRISQLTLDPRYSRHRSSASQQEPILTVVRALKAKEGGLRSANAFISFLTTGPEGPDGRPGTKDDVPDPLDKCRLPADAKRDRLFAAAARRLATAPRERGCLYIYWDKPTEALRAFREHYLQATTSTGLQAAAALLSQVMRALGRPDADVDAFFGYQNYGPNGKDGKPRTKDDLKDPILKLK